MLQTSGNESCTWPKALLSFLVQLNVPDVRNSPENFKMSKLYSTVKKSSHWTSRLFQDHRHLCSLRGSWFQIPHGHISKYGRHVALFCSKVFKSWLFQFAVFASLCIAFLTRQHLWRDKINEKIFELHLLGPFKRKRTYLGKNQPKGLLFEEAYASSTSRQGPLHAGFTVKFFR